ncbi:MAG: DNA polymerase III subunit gamma/tau [Clostridiales bacterium]|nr:DNA polymerase III subunit gamma/tau [Clostridiales bacterium]
MYLALYRKWRPATFDDVISQSHITTTLKNQISQNKTAHAYLFTGSRGTGKTTCAKIFAKAINCTNPQDGNPCLECSVCEGLENGSITDVVEIDAASNNGVDDIRELRERAHFTPAFCSYRVYIIDEVHMLTTQAFNALLKIMEEPPPHVKFVLATTEAHKVPVTILSRCQRFDFKRIKVEDSVERLLQIASAEDVKLEHDAAHLIARLSDGAMRDAISLLDQIISVTSDITVDSVTSTVGIAGQEYLFSLASCIQRLDNAAAMEIVDELYQQSKDLQRLCEELIEHFRSLMLIKSVKNADAFLKDIAYQKDSLKEQAQEFTMGEVLRCITLLQECNDRIVHSSGKRIELEMCLIKLCSPEVDDTHDALLSRIENLERQIKALEGGATPSLVRSEERATGTSNLPAKEEKPQETQRSIKKDIERGVQQNPQPKHEESSLSDSEDEQNYELSPVREWPHIMEELGKKAPHLKGVLEDSVAFTHGEVIYVDSPNAMFGMLIKRDGNAKYLIEAVRSSLGKEYRIRLRKSKPKAKKVEANPIDELLLNASDAGIEVEK